MKDRIAFIRQLEAILVFKEVTETITACRDPKDDKFLELAVAANAARIITGDNDLFVLHPFRNISILNGAGFPAQF